MKAIWTPIIFEKKTRRKRKLAKDLSVLIDVGDGFLVVDMLKGFVTDGCSRPSIFWWYLKRWGKDKELVCYLVHDALFAHKKFTLSFINNLLRDMLEETAGYRESKAEVVRQATSSYFGRKAYEEVDADDLANETLIKVEWNAR